MLTILTGVRESAEAAQRTAPRAADMSALLGEIVAAAQAAVARTPDLLPLLKQALSGCSAEYIEHEGAIAELRRLQR